MAVILPECFTCAYYNRKTASCPVYEKGIPLEVLQREKKDLSQCDDKYHYIFKKLNDNSPSATSPI